MKRMSFFRLTLVILGCIPGISNLPAQQVILNNWEFHKAKDAAWYPATVPGTVHTDLLANQRIPNPFTEDHEASLQWIDSVDWEYRTQFTLTHQQLTSADISLVFEGLDTYATVTLNGKTIRETDNMFRTWRSEVKKNLKSGSNELSVYFHATSARGKNLAAALPYTLPGDEKVFTRKAQFHYGWDWGPRYIGCGIWKPVYLDLQNTVTLHDIHITQALPHPDTALLNVILDLSFFKKGDFNIKVISTDPDTLYYSSSLKGKKGLHQQVPISITLLHPRLWWPNGSGNPFLYHFNILLEKEGMILTEKTVSVGIRTIELMQQQDAEGTSFLFQVNGTPVFMKGANIIPADHFLPRVDSAKIHALITDAVNSNMNMLRVWGGGVYADDYFYSLCDEKGIMVWQDFMFACAMYPGDAAFLANVREEARQQIVRLRNHPSLALWCGNNEADEGWKNWGWQKEFGYSKTDSAKIWQDYLTLFHKLIPDEVNALDPGRPYWPSSPSIGWGHPESLREGDAHYWGIWWGNEPFSNYKTKVGRFMSEYGFQGFPDINTLDYITHRENNYLGSSALKAHQKHPRGFETIRAYMERDYKVPHLFKNYIYVSQILQAEGIRTAVEAHRRDKPRCMGTLYWQLNDSWPVISWSGIDWAGRWKAMQYAVRRAYEPVMVSLEEEKTGDITVHIINDGPVNKGGHLEIRLFTFFGNQVFYKGVRNIHAGTTTNEKVTLQHTEFRDFLDRFGKNQCVLETIFEDLDGNRYENHYFFVPPKEMPLVQDLKSTLTILSDTSYLVELEASQLAKNVWLHLETGEARFSNNYFDLLPNRKTSVICYTSIPQSRLERLLRIHTLGTPEGE